MCVFSRFACVRLFATPWTIAHQVPLSLGFSRQEYWEWVAMPSSRGSSRPRDQARISCASCIAGGFLTTEPPEKPAWGPGGAVNAMLLPHLGGDALGSMMPVRERGGRSSLKGNMGPGVKRDKANAELPFLRISMCSHFSA